MKKYENTFQSPVSGCNFSMTDSNLICATSLDKTISILSLNEKRY